jgi:hypothetical protein
LNRQRNTALIGPYCVGYRLLLGAANGRVDVRNTVRLLKPLNGNIFTIVTAR